MRTISTGEDSTLGTYRKIALGLSLAYDNNRAVEFIDKKIANSPNGENEEVIADEHQMIFLMISLLEGERE